LDSINIGNLDFCFAVGSWIFGYKRGVMGQYYRRRAYFDSFFVGNFRENAVFSLNALLIKKMVKIYSTQTCPYCEMAKEYLNEQGIKYKNYDVANDETARKEMVEKSGQMGVPVIDIDGKIIIGFNKPEIEKALNLNK